MVPGLFVCTLRLGNPACQYQLEWEIKNAEESNDNDSIHDQYVKVIGLWDH